MVCTRFFGGKIEFEREPLFIFAAESCQGKLYAKWFKFSRQKTYIIFENFLVDAFTGILLNKYYIIIYQLLILYRRMNKDI